MHTRQEQTEGTEQQEGIEFRNPLTRKIAGFLEGIGIPVRAATIEEATFLPGVIIDRGTLLVDEQKLLYPGDLLHEGGHIAVMAPEERRAKRGDLGHDPGGEMAAIAWSYAALTHLGLEPEVVFHPEGYHGGSASIIENFSRRHYFGVPLLAYFGLTDGEEFYPEMRAWVRE